jgi:hypothetical protein
VKGFGIEIKNNLLEPKHIKAMGNAVWLYMYLLDKVTSINEDQEGIVLGGKPIKFNEIKDELGISQNTYTQWIDTLIEYPYIKATRTPFGYSFRIFKIHKRFTRNSDSQKTGTVIHKKSDSDSQKSRNPIKTITVDNNSRHKEIYKEKYSSIKDLTPDVLEEIAIQYGVAPAFVNMQLEALRNYCESKNKRYSNYKAALRNFVLGEIKNQTRIG